MFKKKFSENYEWFKKLVDFDKGMLMNNNRKRIISILLKCRNFSLKMISNSFM